MRISLLSTSIVMSATLASSIGWCLCQLVSVAAYLLLFWDVTVYESALKQLAEYEEFIGNSYLVCLFVAFCYMTHHLYLWYSVKPPEPRFRMKGRIKAN